MKFILAANLFLFSLNAFAANSQIKTFGAPIKSTEAVEIDSVLSHPKENMSKVIVADAKIKKVCTAKGCWMEVGGEKEAVRVTFKDYGFFVPKDIVGKKVRIQGKLTEKTMSVKEQKHYLEDEGAPKTELAKITEPKFVYEFIADGVELIE